jgi:hypothetical protein
MNVFILHLWEKVFIDLVDVMLIIRQYDGRAIAKAVSRWLPTAAALVQSRVWSSGICGGQSGAGAGFLRVLRFPLPFIPPNSPITISGRRAEWTQFGLHPPLCKLKKKQYDSDGVQLGLFCFFVIE